METIHLVCEQGALCHAADARWCTALQETVSCPECRRLMALRRVREVDALQRAGRGEAPAPKARPGEEE